MEKCLGAEKCPGVEKSREVEVGKHLEAGKHSEVGKVSEKSRLATVLAVVQAVVPVAVLDIGTHGVIATISVDSKEPVWQGAEEEESREGCGFEYIAFFALSRGALKGGTPPPSSVPMSCDRDNC